MARTHESKTVFVTERRTITVTQQENGRYTVRVEAQKWRVTRVNLGDDRCAWFVLMAASGRRRRALARVIPRKTARSMRIMYEEGNLKTSGINWIALRMAGGARPIILKAPQLFRNGLLYIEPTETSGVYSARIIDPDTDRRTPEHIMSELEVQQALNTFAHA